MKLKNVLVIAGVLLMGVVNAQEKTSPTPPRSVVPTPPPPPALVPNSKQIQEPEVVDFPDIDAEFPGGIEAMRKFIQENVKYPEASRELGEEGRVYLSFIVEVDGSISAIDVLRSRLSQGLNDEAKRILSSMPAWKPGEVKGKPVRCRCRLPISFTLGSPEKK